MPSLDEIIDRIRDFAGADFAFILTRRGRLVTHHAPENMPERGRLDLVAAAEKLLGTDGVALRTMPREALVPYGGAAPIDVYVAARDAAILCVVMSTWTDNSSVAHAFERGLVEVDDLIASEMEKRMGPKSTDPPETTRRRRRTIAPPSSAAPDANRQPVWTSRMGRNTLPGLDEAAPTVPRPPPVPRAPKSSRPRTQRPPPMRKPTPGRGTFPMVPGTPPPPALPPDPPSAPEISVGLSPIGRGTMAVIEIDAQGPDITLGTATVGRHTMAAIDVSSVPSGVGGGASLPDIRLTLASMPELDTREMDVPDRQTLPFTEPAHEAKKTFEQHVTTPDVRVKLAELDWETKNAVLEERKKAELEEAARNARREAEAALKLRLRNSNIDVWHEALSELVTEDQKPTRKRPRSK